MKNEWLFLDEEIPTEPGWYAVTRCWEPAEGVFPGACFYDGAKWSEASGLFQRSPKTFASEEKAERWAYEHDLEAA